MQIECIASSLFEYSAEMQLIFCKDNANERRISSLLEYSAECSLSSAKIMQTSVEYQACLNILPSAAYLLQRYKKYLLMQ